MPLAQYLKSAVLPEDYPVGDRPEIALVGRSNAGKSSLLNAMCGGHKVAKISKTPGKTRLINFFDVGERYRLVDLPGYGYAARDLTERKMWAKMIQDFFDVRTNLIGLLLICDMRRDWQEDESKVFELANKRNLHMLTVLTKLDKLGHGESKKLYQQWINTSKQDKSFFYPVSALKNDGVRELEDFIFKNWIKE
ncbi:MAG: ribosome biogenesis GTP-binding protein YihA/YsxC [Oligoflexia bacterium]|nr:ribosome biogenesis GTP-binding protein YihA/YsxC [Oligoflexia bacterium]